MPNKEKRETTLGPYSLLDIISKENGSNYIIKRISSGKMVLYNPEYRITLNGHLSLEQITKSGYQVIGKATREDMRK